MSTKQKQCGGARLYQSDPTHINFFRHVLRNGQVNQGKNEAERKAQMMQMPMLAGRFLDHPMKTTDRRVFRMPALSEFVSLPNTYRENALEYQSKTNFDQGTAEDVAVRDIFGREVSAQPETGDPVIASRIQTLERTIPQNTPGRDALIRELTQEFIRDRLRARDIPRAGGAMRDGAEIVRQQALAGAGDAVAGTGAGEGRPRQQRAPRLSLDELIDIFNRNPADLTRNRLQRIARSLNISTSESRDSLRNSIRERLSARVDSSSDVASRRRDDLPRVSQVPQFPQAPQVPRGLTSEQLRSMFG